MARPFSATDVKRIIAEHRELLKQLSEVEGFLTECRSEIESAAEKLVTCEVLNVLKDIPVEEINRDKRGIRVKALRDYGYSSVTDKTC